METVVLTEYSHEGISGTIYHPCVTDGIWSLGYLSHISLYDVALLCLIPDDEVLLLKLKYGG